MGQFQGETLLTFFSGMASNNILLTKLPASPWVLTSLERKPSATRWKRVFLIQWLSFWFNLSDARLRNIVGHEFCQRCWSVQEQVRVLKESARTGSRCRLPWRGRPGCCGYSCHLQRVPQIPGVSRCWEGFRRTICRSTGDYWLRGTGDTSGTQTTTPITIPPTRFKKCWSQI